MVLYGQCCYDNATLQVLLTFIGSQLRDVKCVVILNDFGMRKITRAVLFYICCMRSVTSFVEPEQTSVVASHQ